MAVTAIWYIKGRVEDVLRYASNPEKTTEENAQAAANLHAVGKIIEYAADDMKTEKLMFVSGINCNTQNAVKKFNEDLNRWGNKGERVCYHGYQSFAEGEVDAKTAHEIGKKLAQKLWGDKYRVLVATHCNTGHYHNHFVICATSMNDGRKFDNSGKDHFLMRQESDRLCREYGLSVIEHTRENGKNYGEWLAEKEGRPTLRSVIREAIDVAIKGSVSQQQFLAAMDEMGFVIDQHGKHAKIKQIGNERFIRFDSLGLGYSVNEIIERIYLNEEIEYPDIPKQESPRQIFEEENKPVEKMNYIEVNRCYFKALTVTRERPKTNRRMYFLIRQDHSAMRIYQDQLSLVTEHHLTSEAEVRAYKIKAMADIDSLTETRRQLWAEFKRAQRLKGSDGETLSGKIRMTITQCTSSLSKLRREVTSCDEVLERIDRMRENLMRIEQSKFRGKEQPVRFAPDKDKVTEQIIRTKNQREEVRKK